MLDVSRSSFFQYRRGNLMSTPSMTSTSSDVPAQVWETLNSELQGCVIRLLIQLTVALLIAQTDPSAKKEDCNAHPPESSKNPD
jgi:hypothetical protein